MIVNVNQYKFLPCKNTNQWLSQFRTWDSHPTMFAATCYTSEDAVNQF